MAYQGLNRDETEGDVRMEYSNPNEQLPLPGRLGEYERILRFSTERLHSKHARVLFVFGACGCGKTSSILRALRSFSARPLSSDNRKLVVSAAPSAVKRARSSNSATLSGVKRRRSEADDVSGTTSAEDSPGRRSGSSASSAAAASSSPSSGRSSASPIDAAESELQRGFSELSERYDVLYTTRSGRRPIQGHYINCADLTSQQLIDAVHHSIHAAFPRSADANTKALLTSLEALAEATKKSRGRVKTSSMPKEPSITAGDAAAVCGRGARTMHLVALDEVEYARPAAKAILSELASLSFRYPTQLALIYISNVRHLVHVPQMLLEELAFEAYDVPTLRLIAQRIASVEIAACEQRCTLVSQPVQAITRGAKKKKPVTADATRVKLSAGLLEYIARKALLEFSGDVRQVAAMTRRAIFRAFAEWASSYSVDECERSMRAAVDEAGEDMDKQRSSTGSSSSEGAGASTPKAAVAAASTRSTSINVTLAGASKGLSGHQVEMHVQQHISSMPEQMLFVLCCLMVLTWRIGMGVGSNNQFSLATVASSTTTTSTTLSVRRVHALYTALMGLHHFPSMSRAGILSAIDGLADLGILTRPQRRGSEEVFTLNGVWSLVAMEAALKARGEALRQEREACGLDGSENKFSAVLSDLRQIAQLPCLA